MTGMNCLVNNEQLGECMNTWMGGWMNKLSKFKKKPLMLFQTAKKSQASPTINRRGRVVNIGRL